MKKGFVVVLVSLLLMGCAARGDPYGNPYPRVSDELAARFGCDPELMERERANWNYVVNVGESICVALARYGKPYSMSIDHNRYFDSVFLVWRIEALPYRRLASVTAFKYKSNTRFLLPGRRTDCWCIESVMGFEGY